MAKNEKKFLKFNNIAFLLFSPAAEIWPKQKNIFEILQHMAKNKKNIFEILQRSIPRYGQKRKKNFLILQRSIHCAAFKIDAFGPIPSLLFSSEAEIWPKTKNIFKFNNIPFILIEIWPKTKKIFLKFYNIALCIRAYSEFFIFTSSRDMAKKQKNIFKFGNIAFLLFSSEAEIWPKNKKKYFLNLTT
ncbi:hypothetical protein PUN28_020345 [Cardiocondyla obscurior]|uniref:Uncharacterized protein n=1 Tax=Cardiocondyla obscurior TaxID=286306 RepID=A0AAW2E5V8_9HYME